LARRRVGTATGLYALRAPNSHDWGFGLAVTLPRAKRLRNGEHTVSVWRSHSVPRLRRSLGCAASARLFGAAGRSSTLPATRYPRAPGSLLFCRKGPGNAPNTTAELTKKARILRNISSLSRISLWQHRPEDVRIGGVAEYGGAMNGNDLEGLFRLGEVILVPIAVIGAIYSGEHLSFWIEQSALRREAKKAKMHCPSPQP
jgi:hypothetical protein